MPEYMIRVKDGAKGPYTGAAIKTFVSQGKLTKEHELSNDGGKTWRKAGTLKGLFPVEPKYDEDAPLQLADEPTPLPRNKVAAPPPAQEPEPEKEEEKPKAAPGTLPTKRKPKPLGERDKAPKKAKPEKEPEPLPAAPQRVAPPPPVAPQTQYAMPSGNPFSPGLSATHAQDYVNRPGQVLRGRIALGMGFTGWVLLLVGAALLPLITRTQSSDSALDIAWAGLQLVMDGEIGLMSLSGFIAGVPLLGAIAGIGLEIKGILRLESTAAFRNRVGLASIAVCAPSIYFALDAGDAKALGTAVGAGTYLIGAGALVLIASNFVDRE